MKWLPREARDIARAYFAWVEYARTRRWARSVAQLAGSIVEPGVHRAVITCGPPHMAHEAGRLVAARARLPLVLDFRDPWSQVQRLPEAIASRVWLHLAARYERRAVGSASLVVANSETARGQMQQCYPTAAGRIIAIPNGYDEDEIIGNGRRPVGFTMGYAGTIYLDRDPRPLFRAAARVIARRALTPRDLGIELMGTVESFDGVSLEEIARAEGVAEFVRLHPVRPRAEALRFLAQAAMLVVLPQDSDMAIPAKLFDYMLCDAWLLVLAQPGSALDQLLQGSGADVVSPQALDRLSQVIDARYSAYLRGERAVRLATQPRFSRRERARVLFQAIEAVCAAS